ncbi:hypothetical protein I312_103519 [Cryptococcus bacillisporus CA1280]|uniref:Golgi to ER traffic protein 2 n=1 Tax=Cryptococcus bacillisporus CA1280 TaxID=1296109 RepID=A0A0D0VID6_CRYGA|nr:hypothetical protein I312_03502 [Cryptococcus bacillisporus CA1280]
MSEQPQQSEAARRAAARKAKILARGNAGLNKLAQSARGEEAQKLYPDSPNPSSNISTPGTDKESKQPQWAPQPSTSAPRSPQPQMSSDQAAMARQLEAMMSMLGTPGAQSSGGGAEMPDMSRLLAQMMGDPSLASGPNAQGQGMIGDVDDPAGLGGMGPGGIPPNLSDLFGGAGAGDPSFPGFGGAGTGQQQGKGKVEKYFPLAHFISVILLAVFAVTWWEPALRMTAAFRTENVWADRWAGFAGRVKGLGEVEVLPIFWAFVTVELILQTSRLMILKSPPAPHSLLQNFLPVLPPSISRPLLTGSRYLSLLSQTYKDGCLLIFMVGTTVVVADWLRGSLVV